jgi:hypothetical protein
MDLFLRDRSGLTAATRVFRSVNSCLKGRFRASHLHLFAPAANHQPPFQAMCVTVANCGHQPFIK